MRIGIIGCGTFGSAVLELLADEGHEITAMDTNAENIQAINDTRDVMGLVGSGGDIEMLNSMEVDKMDIFIACSGSDEINMLASTLAKKLGAKHTIARLRNHEYNSKAARFIKEKLEIDLTVNPDFLTAKAAFDILHRKKHGYYMLLGSDITTIYLARLLLKEGHDVKIIEENEDKCYQVCAQLPENAMIIKGTSADHQLLINEGLLEINGFISMTEFDEENILTSMFALEHEVPTIVTKLTKTSYIQIVNNLNLENIVSPRTATAEIIVNYIKELKENK